MKVVAGVGSNDTMTSVRLAESAKAIGADGILMVTPYYNKTTQRGLVQHFTTVADRVDIPMDIFTRRGRFWQRSFEEHIEYSHEPEGLLRLLSEAGFTNAEKRSDGPQNELGRVFIIAENTAH